MIDDFWSAVQKTASGFSLDMTPDCADNIDAFIRTGVDRLAEKEEFYSLVSIDDAKEHLIRFVEVMADEARMQNLDMLEKITFEIARSRLCPLYPFC